MKKGCDDDLIAGEFDKDVKETGGIIKIMISMMVCTSGKV